MNTYREDRNAVNKPVQPTDYTVDLWGSEPFTDDDCWAGAAFATREEAEAYLKEVVEELESGKRVQGGYCSNKDTEYVVLDGPDVHREVRIKSFSPEPVDYSDWDNEMAMQAGMAFGCDGYNDVMGY